MPLRTKWSPAMAAAIAVLLCTVGVAAGNAEASLHRNSSRTESREVVSAGSHLVKSARSGGTAELARATTDDADEQSEVDEPIRITAFTADLENSNRYCRKAGDERPDFKGLKVNCEVDDILTDAKRTLLKDVVLPGAVRLHTERLNVKRVTGNLSLSGIDSSGSCGEFTIPAAHEETGVPETDFALYIGAGPASDSTVAWALTCMYLPTDSRPAVGVLNVPPRTITGNSHQVRLIAHEILHALGFNSSLFSRSGMTKEVSPLREKTNTVLSINSTKAVAAAREHYGCPSMTFVELEDEGGSGVTETHWKRRSAKDELMAPIVGAGYYTAMTLAVMEDLGYYTANYAKAEPMSWGRSAGCELFEEKCVKDSTTQFPSMFCTPEDESTNLCTSDRLYIGSCNLVTYTTELPSAMRYFSNNAKLGGGDAYMDYCPVFSGTSSTSCTEGDIDSMPGSVIHDGSRCFDAWKLTLSSSESYHRAICARVACDETTQTYEVLFSGANSWLPCDAFATPSESGSSMFNSEGFITCPSYADMCVSNSGSSGTTDTGFDKFPRPDSSQNSPGSSYVTWRIIALIWLFHSFVVM